MKQFFRQNALSAAVFSVVFYIVSVFLTLDTYCKNEVTPETPLLNIAGLPFLRMDFVLIVFSLAFLLGALLSLLLKSAAKLLPFGLGALGCIAVFLCFFDVNTMQLLSPTMRISHVIMTVSRVLAIVAGASGLLAGFCLAALRGRTVGKKAVVSAAVVAVLFSVGANAENGQTTQYFVCALLLLCASCLADFAPYQGTAPARASFFKGAVAKPAIGQFICVLALTVLFGILYGVLCASAGFGETAYTLAGGVVLLCLFAVFDLADFGPASCLAAFLGSVLSFVGVHYLSAVVTYSGNRVVYEVPYWLAGVCVVLAVLGAWLKWPHCRQTTAVQSDVSKE